MLSKVNKIVCHCKKIQASLRASIFEAILQSVTSKTLIHINLNTLQ